MSLMIVRLRIITAIIITISSVMENAHQTPVTPIAFPKKYAIGKRITTCLAAETIILGVPTESPCRA